MVIMHLAKAPARATPEPVDRPALAMGRAPAASALPSGRWSGLLRLRRRPGRLERPFDGLVERHSYSYPLARVVLPGAVVASRHSSLPVPIHVFPVADVEHEDFAVATECIEHPIVARANTVHIKRAVHHTLHPSPILADAGLCSAR